MFLYSKQNAFQILKANISLDFKEKKPILIKKLENFQ